jgi:hypothetical protein
MALDKKISTYIYIAISKNDMVAAYCIHTHEHKHALHVYAFEI